MAQHQTNIVYVVCPGISTGEAAEVAELQSRLATEQQVQMDKLRYQLEQQHQAALEEANQQAEKEKVWAPPPCSAKASTSNCSLEK